MAVRGKYPGALRTVLTRATHTELTRVAIRVQNEARRQCPVDTGRLRGSIGYSIHGLSPETMSARVGSNVDYALAVHNGHGVITPKTAQVLRFPVKGGGVVFTKRVRAVPGKPFLKEALRLVRVA